MCIRYDNSRNSPRYDCSSSILNSHGQAACSLDSQASDELLEDCKEQYPNTKVIQYPYNVVDEQATLMMLDEVLNTWGRYVCSCHFAAWAALPLPPIMT